MFPPQNILLKTATSKTKITTTKSRTRNKTEIKQKSYYFYFLITGFTNRDNHIWFLRCFCSVVVKYKMLLTRDSKIVPMILYLLISVMDNSVLLTKKNPMLFQLQKWAYKLHFWTFNEFPQTVNHLSWWLAIKIRSSGVGSHP